MLHSSEIKKVDFGDVLFYDNALKLLDCTGILYHELKSIEGCEPSDDVNEALVRYSECMSIFLISCNYYLETTIIFFFL